MRKLVLFILIAFFGFNYVYAQEAQLVNDDYYLLAINDNEFEVLTDADASTTSNLFLNKVSLAIIGGINFTTLTGDDADSFECLTCFHLGIAAMVPISELFAIQPELLYACMGSKYSEGGYIEPIETSGRTVTGELSGTYKLNYLLLPVMAKYEVVPGLSLEAGPQVGFLLSAEDDYEFNGTSMTEDVKDFTKGIDFAFNAGIGYKFDAGYHVRARYMIGLTDVTDFEEPSNAEWKNSGAFISVGYFF